MTDRDPIDTLAGISDVLEYPDPEFAERLLGDLLADLASLSIDDVGDAPDDGLEAINPPPAADVSAIETPAIETTRSEAGSSDQPFAVMELRPDDEERTMAKTGWIVGGSIAAAITLIVGIFLTMDEDTNVDVTTDRTPVESTAAPETPTAIDAVDPLRLQLVSVPFPDGGLVTEASGGSGHNSATIQYPSDRFDTLVDFYSDWTLNDNREWIFSGPSTGRRDTSWEYGPLGNTSRIRVAECGNAGGQSDSTCVTIYEAGDFPP